MELSPIIGWKIAFTYYINEALTPNSFQACGADMCASSHILDDWNRTIIFQHCPKYGTFHFPAAQSYLILAFNHSIVRLYEMDCHDRTFGPARAGRNFRYSTLTDTEAVCTWLPLFPVTVTV